MATLTCHLRYSRGEIASERLRGWIATVLTACC